MEMFSEVIGIGPFAEELLSTLNTVKNSISAPKMKRW